MPYGPTTELSPQAVVACFRLRPSSWLFAIHRCIHQAKLTEFNSYGFKASFNPAHPGLALLSDQIKLSKPKLSM